jgi:hypothetical protein
MGEIVGLAREQKLKVLQDSYKEWVTLYPKEKEFPLGRGFDTCSLVQPR